LWLLDCQQSHKPCNALHKQQNLTSARDIFLPTRLIDIGTSHDTAIKLVHTIDILAKESPIPRYVTLSHCWGGSSLLQLKKSSLAAFQRKLPIGEFPKTYVDAIEVSRALGIRYIWIDSLCIVQDDTDDWRREAARMSEVYSHSFVTIAASASKDGNGGLFYTKSPGATFPFEITVPKGRAQGHYLCYDTSVWRENVEGAILNSRAWVLQERLLSRRLLHFTQDQVYWQCEVEHGPRRVLGLRERRSLPYERPMQWSSPEVRLDEDFGLERWVEIVERYTRLQLTYESDRLLAVSGLARRLSEISVLNSADYLAGLWRQQLPAQLLWFRLAWRDPVRRSPEVAPSWSWASVNAPVSFYPVKTLSKDFKILAASSRVVSDPFGQVSHGRLVVQGRLCQGSMVAMNGTRSHRIGVNGVAKSSGCFAGPAGHCKFRLEGNEHICLNLDTGLLTSGDDQRDFYAGQIVLLLIDYTHGLILCPHSGTGTLRRLGHWSMDFTDEEELVSATFETQNVIDPMFYKKSHGNGLYTVEII
jgi:Heterokaryon incompatibility protein (HET)